jgi:hypothetical protein
LASAKLRSGLFSSFVDALAHPAEPVLIDALPAGFPHVPRHHFGQVCALCALLTHRAVRTLVCIGVVLPVAFPIGGAVSEQLSVGADIDIQLLVIAVLALVEVAIAMRGQAIADHSIDAALFQTLCNGCGRIAGIDAHGPDLASCLT